MLSREIDLALAYVSARLLGFTFISGHVTIDILTEVLIREN